MNQLQPAYPTVEETIRQAYHRVERETLGIESAELRILATDNKIVIVARQSSNSRNEGALRTLDLRAYENALRTEFAAELGCRIVSMRTNIALADDERMNIFQLNGPLH